MTFAGFSIESKMQANQADLERHALAADRAANIIENSLLHIGHGLADIARVVEIAEQSNASQSNAFQCQRIRKPPIILFVCSDHLAIGKVRFLLSYRLLQEAVEQQLSALREEHIVLSSWSLTDIS